MTTKRDIRLLIGQYARYYETGGNWEQGKEAEKEIFRASCPISWTKDQCLKCLANYEIMYKLAKLYFSKSRDLEQPVAKTLEIEMQQELYLAIRDIILNKLSNHNDKSKLIEKYS